jgi:(1->4)-alpha-D-glucan 1-alpha-D-glucosylmutase
MSEIVPGYTDVWGSEKKLDPKVRRQLEAALGRPRKARRLRLEKGRCWQPELLERGGRIWGFAVQLYGLRSARNWGIGDFGDLRALVELAAGLGASIVGVNPLHATQGSPYSPSSRHALNFAYLDVEAIPEYGQCEPARRLVESRAFQARLAKLRAAELVDYAGVAAAKQEVLELVFRSTRPKGNGQTRELRDFAVFEALREKLGGGWQQWPEKYRDPGSPEVRRFIEKHRRRVAFHAFVQARAREQLDAVQARALALGMPAGLYFDLALGADRGGAEVWADQAAYALQASCGAPPDEFNPRGQDWGLPPYSPRALRAKGYAPFAALLRANMPRGGALRMDHVMALMRLYWIPLGNKPEQGGYVRYPLEELLSVLCKASRESQCAVIGEDLGTVPPALRDALGAHGVLSYRPLLFEKVPSGRYPREAMVCVSTHDLPTWRGYWAGRDLDWREKLGLSVDARKERDQRRSDQQKLKSLLEKEGLDASAASAHAFIARTPCKIAVVQPEDVFEIAEQANLPGTVAEHPNWRRKLPAPLEQWAADPRLAGLAQAFAERRAQLLPRATYRLQFHKGFRFADARKLVPYLARLGVSHLYASPFLKARPGSMHGYDVVDHNAVNPEIGTEADLHALIASLKSHGMGLVMDLVPNHMGVLHADNAWWLDVLEKGKASPYARFFDIDWQAGKLLLPVLGKHYGEALESGELKVRGNSVCYFDHRFPLNRKSLQGINIREVQKNTLALHRLLEQQHYRLAYWRVASDEINYRRFFEITDLAGVRVEDKAVFDATHALVRRLASRGGVDGVRIDHPDGLADPRQYLERLRGVFPRRWIVVEKILAAHERLPEDWPVHGTTGYRFANVLTGVFVDASAESRFERLYRRFTGESQGFAETAYLARWLIMSTTLAAELHMLSSWLARIAAGNRSTRDYTASGLRLAIAEIAARFPVYRTYVTHDQISSTDRRHIDWAVGAAKRASRIADPSVFDFVRSVLTLEAAPRAGERRVQMLRFVTRFQQFTAPVVAKGVEDTAFYRYNRLIALNEVGGEPERFGLSLKAFHAAQEDRARRWPHTMLGSSTHDTKRSEDVRARLGVLSELAPAWRMALRRWSLVNRSHHTELEGEAAPTRGDEYHFYQALVGIWPGRSPEELAARLKAYMLKAAREAKLRTSWINPDAAYEAALERFVDGALQSGLFRQELEATVGRLAHLGMLVGLSQALLKVASPGVPDYYQGTELWDFSLVDPDNRRPVDYELRRRMLEEKPWSPEELMANLADGRAKLHVIRKGLELRKRFPGLFHGARYQPLHADGEREDNLCAFALSAGADAIIAAAPRLFARLMAPDDVAPVGERVWGGSRIRIPEGAWLDVLTGERHAGGELRLAALLATFPVALLVRADTN